MAGKPGSFALVSLLPASAPVKHSLFSLEIDPATLASVYSSRSLISLLLTVGKV